MADIDALKDYTCFDHTDAEGRWTRPVYWRGSGPAVIVMHEVPGLHPLVVRFADRVAAAGMTVFLPSLFGKPGKQVSKGYAVGEILLNICIRREFNVWANDRSSPIVDWLRDLARTVHAECGGKGVGALGMCFTGGFALAMMTEPAVVAPVLSQPSMPIGRGSKGKIDASPREIACAKARMEAEDLSMIGLRFTSDRLVPHERWDMLKDTFGDRFEAIDLKDEDAQGGTGVAPHSVLTIHLRDQDQAGATRQAEGRVIGFFKGALGA